MNYLLTMRRKQKSATAISTISALLLTVALIVTGCASTQSGQGAYPTLKQTQMNVDWPMTRYRNASAAGALTLAERQNIDAAYTRYRTAFDAAVKEAGGNMSVTTPDNVKQLTNELLTALGALPL